LKDDIELVNSEILNIRTTVLPTLETNLRVDFDRKLIAVQEDLMKIVNNNSQSLQSIVSSVSNEVIVIQTLAVQNRENLGSAFNQIDRATNNINKILLQLSGGSLYVDLPIGTTDFDISCEYRALGSFSDGLQFQNNNVQQPIVAMSAAVITPSRLYFHATLNMSHISGGSSEFGTEYSGSARQPFIFAFPPESGSTVSREVMGDSLGNVGAAFYIQRLQRRC
jgi:hypothetical protein